MFLPNIPKAKVFLVTLERAVYTDYTTLWKMKGQAMQVQHEQARNEVIETLQRQVDELTAANRQLTEQLASKERFAAMIAHELRSPLTPIINYAQIIARPNQRHEAIVRGTDIIISQ